MHHVARNDTLRESSHTIKAVTFDLWETLLFEEDGASAERTSARCRKLAQTLNGFGARVSIEQVGDALNNTVSSLLEKWNKNKDVAHVDQIQLFLENLPKKPAMPKTELIEDLSSAYISPFFEVPPYLNPDAHIALKWLKDRHNLIGLICNTGLTPGTALRRFLSEQDVSDYFDLMVFSDEVGIRKPDGRIFQLVAKKMKMEPCEIVHIGDNLKADVYGAKSAGFKAIHFSSDVGRDKIAEADPRSLVSISRNLSSLEEGQMKPDKTIASLATVRKAIEEIEVATS